MKHLKAKDSMAYFLDTCNYDPNPHNKDFNKQSNSIANKNLDRIRKNIENNCLAKVINDFTAYITQPLPKIIKDGTTDNKMAALHELYEMESDYDHLKAIIKKRPDKYSGSLSYWWDDPVSAIGAAVIVSICLAIVIPVSVFLSILIAICSGVILYFLFMFIAGTAWEYKINMDTYNFDFICKAIEARFKISHIDQKIAKYGDDLTAIIREQQEAIDPDFNKHLDDYSGGLDHNKIYEAIMNYKKTIPIKEAVKGGIELIIQQNRIKTLEKKKEDDWFK